MSSLLFLLAMFAFIWWTRKNWWTKKNYAMIKGNIGEKQVSKQLNELDPEHYILLNDLYIPKKDGSTAQIDHILISHKGIFVIETKNYRGWIMGSEHHQYWTQVIYKRKEKFYNPIWQNAGHIKALRDYLGDLIHDVPLHSVIVFGNQATLKFKTPFTKAKVIEIQRLLDVIQNEPKTNLISSYKRQKIKQRLASLYVKSKKEQKKISKKHISDIEQKRSNRNKKVKINVCPRCGGELVQRKGQYGPFKGCSNFPNCRFTA